LKRDERQSGTDHRLGENSGRKQLRGFDAWAAAHLEYEQRNPREDQQGRGNTGARRRNGDVMTLELETCFETLTEIG
jgi:hypothetical protein